jgi:replication fork clamp-binding protein CrfC
MKWESATKHQLLQIALHEDCSIDNKYRATSELQMRWNAEMLPDVVRLYGKGSSASDIAEYLGIKVEMVGGMISKYGLRRVTE